MTKINSDIANKIRDEYSRGGISQDRIADMYGVSQTLVSVIVRNVLWKREDHARQN